MPLIETLVVRVACLLEPEERSVILGDLAESGVDGWPALRDVLGLAIRRQAALWRGWRPWTALVGVVGTVGLPVNLIALLAFSSVAGKAVQRASLRFQLLNVIAMTCWMMGSS